MTRLTLMHDTHGRIGNIRTWCHILEGDVDKLTKEEVLKAVERIRMSCTELVDTLDVWYKEDKNKEELKKVDVWYAILTDKSTSSVYPKYFLDESSASNTYEEEGNNSSEEPVGYIETYEGSNIHKEAVKNTK